MFIGPVVENPPHQVYVSRPRLRCKEVMSFELDASLKFGWKQRLTLSHNIRLVLYHKTELFCVLRKILAYYAMSAANTDKERVWPVDARPVKSIQKLP